MLLQDVNRAELVSLMAQYVVLLMGLGARTQESFHGDEDGFLSKILSGLTVYVYIVVIVAIAFGLWVVLKKTGGLVDGMSAGGEEMFIDDETVDILHKGMVPVANAWAKQASDSDLLKVRELVKEIRAFQESTLVGRAALVLVQFVLLCVPLTQCVCACRNLEYDKNFAQFFKDKDLYTVYSWMTHAEPGEREVLKWFIEQLTDKLFERQYRIVPTCCGLRAYCERRNRSEVSLLVRMAPLPPLSLPATFCGNPGSTVPGLLIRLD